MFSNIIAENREVITTFRDVGIFLNDNEKIRNQNRITQSETVAINSAIV